MNTPAMPGECDVLAGLVKKCNGQLPTLQLYLHANQITARGLQPLLEAPALLEQLQKLALSENPLGDNGGRALAYALEQGSLPALKELQMNHCQLGDRGLQALASALQSDTLPKLSALWLDSNKIGDAGVGALAKVLFATALGKGASWPAPSLMEVHLQLNYISHVGVKGVSELLDATQRLKHTSHLRTFDVRSQLKTVEEQEFAEAEIERQQVTQRVQAAAERQLVDDEAEQQRVEAERQRVETAIKAVEASVAKVEAEQELVESLGAEASRGDESKAKKKAKKKKTRRDSDASDAGNAANGVAALAIAHPRAEGPPVDLTRSLPIGSPLRGGVPAEALSKSLPIGARHFFSPSR